MPFLLPLLATIASLRLGSAQTLTSFVSSGLSAAPTASNIATKHAGVSGVGVDSSGVVYLADSGANCIYKVWGPNNKTAFAGGCCAASGNTPCGAGNVNGVGTAARFNWPHGLVVNPVTGTVYVCDRGNNAIRAISPSGAVTTLASNTVSANIAALGNFNQPTQIAINPAGTALFVSDNTRNTIRKITLPGGVVSNFAGSVSACTSLAPACDGASGCSCSIPEAS